MRIFVLLLFVLNSFHSVSQIRGKVYSVTGKLQAQIIVSASTKDSSWQVTADTSGTFSFSGLSPGRYAVAATGGPPQFVLVKRGKEAVVELLVSPDRYFLPEVQIHSTSTLPSISSHEIDFEKVQRIPASFYDVARMAASYPGLIITDDQANHISVRGLSPVFNLWSIEGAPILNPNHLENAGTFSDRAGMSGGGVMMISSQLLQKANVYTGRMPASAPATTGALIDVKLREGNTKRSEKTFQFSLLGTDLSVEGPFSDKSEASYLINYRYSFVGLLSLMGVNFGNESINYQDLSLHINMPLKKLGTLTLWSINGKSYNHFRSPEDSSEWEIYKDRFDIDYNSTTFLNGLTHKADISPKLLLKSAAAYSVKRNSRIESDALGLIDFAADRQDQELLSFRSSITWFISGSWNAEAGAVGYNSRNRWNTPGTFLNNRQFSSIQLFTEVTHQRKRWRLILGHNTTASTSAATYAFLPRATLAVSLSQKNQLMLHAGAMTQSLQFLPLARNPGSAFSTNLSLTHAYIPDSTWRIESEFFMQDVSSPYDQSQEFSVINYSEEALPTTLHYSSRSNVFIQGIQNKIEKSLSSGYYILLSGTLYDAARSASETRFNSNWAASLSTGRDMTISPARTLSVDIRIVSRGGFNDRYIDPVTGEVPTPFRYNQKLPPYFRSDVRIATRKNRPKTNHLWSLDIQNVTNRKNIAYYYYDPLIKSVIPRYQLGIIPVLSYRIEF